MTTSHAIANQVSRSANRDHYRPRGWHESGLKNEMYYRQAFPDRARARFAVADYIEVFYNRKRLHSTLGYRTPGEALTEFQTAAAAA